MSYLRAKKPPNLGFHVLDSGANHAERVTDAKYEPDMLCPARFKLLFLHAKRYVQITQYSWGITDLLPTSAICPYPTNQKYLL